MAGWCGVWRVEEQPRLQYLFSNGSRMPTDWARLGIIVTDFNYKEHKNTEYSVKQRYLEKLNWFRGILNHRSKQAS